tara:strand:- start:35557 stop:37878 length:2322 start_codon:yes stop_codon:yes gene_type:complete
MKIFLIIITFLSTLFSHDIYHQIYKEIKIYNSSLSNHQILHSLGIDVDHIIKKDEFIQFVISQHDLNKLISENIDFDIIHDDIEEFYKSRLIQNYSSRDFDYGSMGGYYTFDEIEQHLDELSSLYPSLISEKISIGESLEGRNIWAIKVSDNPNIDENEPQALYTGLHHSREPMSYMNLFYFMHWLGENYNSDLLAQHLVNNREIWFIPAINPDGLVYNQSIAPSGGGMQRKNTRDTCSGTPIGVDLNRNYGYLWGYDNDGSSPDGCSETYRGTSPFSEPETQAVRDFVNQHNFKINFNYHSYSDLLIYPFGYEYENNAPQEDIDIFIEYGEDMVQYNDYILGTGPDLLYPVNGDACDWMYGEAGIFSYTPEIGGNSDGFWPATQRILPLAEENLYPNQVLALNAGSKYDVEISLNSEIFNSNDLYPLFISIMNRGLSNANGSVKIDILSSENLIFELDQITLNELDSRESIDLGDITYFELSNQAVNGSLETITVNVYDNDYYYYSDSIEILIGQPTSYIFDDFESNSSWQVGASTDLATAGLWERAIPSPTYEDDNQIVQPGSDYSEFGEYCFMTENSFNPDNEAQSDVDGGSTTLFSPIYDLSMYNQALVSYWKWYTNNLGNNPGTDLWKVEVSNDEGQSWVGLENTSLSNNYWEFNQFIISDFVTLTDKIQFKFVAEDIFNDGDVGSGGSLVEAAIDDFRISIFEDSNQCITGDLNEDAQVNVVDIVLMVNLIIDDNADIDDYLCSSDFNQDSLINIQDIVLLVSLILN